MKTYNCGSIQINNTNALIIFTREPAPGATKTRLMPYYTAEQCAELHKCFLRDIKREAEQVRHNGSDLFVCYTGGEPVFLRDTFGSGASYFGQLGDGLGSRMENAFRHVLGLGYEKAVLIGTDIPEIRADSIERAFTSLDDSDIVIGPTSDGGYYLIGMKEARNEAFDVKLYGTGTVYEETVSHLRLAGLSVTEVATYCDIDEPGDIAELRNRIRSHRDMTHTATGRFIGGNIKISVIIPVYNESSTIDSLLDQLDRSCSKDDVEVIFVDGGSTDDTAERIAGRYKVIRSGKGRGLQMNAGAKESSGDVLFFLHCDSVLPDDFVNEIRRCMTTHQAGCFGVRFPSANLFMFTNRIISNHRALARGLPFGDQGIFIDRRLFFEMGMFPDIPVMEDYEFALRLRNKGIRPGMTRHRIVSSARRYGRGTRSIIETEYLMWYLRRLYRHGMDPAEIAAIYKDIR